MQQTFIYRYNHTEQYITKLRRAMSQLAFEKLMQIFTIRKNITHVELFFFRALPKWSHVESCYAHSRRVTVVHVHKPYNYTLLRETGKECVAQLRKPYKKRRRREPAATLSFTDPSAGSPTETLLRLLLPLDTQAWNFFFWNTILNHVTKVQGSHLNTQSVVATGGVYKGQGHNQR